MEFHFDSRRTDAELYMVFSDEFDVPEGGTKIALDPWIVRRDLKQAELESALRELGVSFDVKAPDHDESQRLVRTESGIQFGFTQQDDGSFYLFAISMRLNEAEQR